MSRRPLIAANWKMNPIPEGALGADSPYHSTTGADVWVFPTYMHIAACVEAELMTGAQAGHHLPTGAHTGDVSMNMLAEAGCRAVLCGHSEQRAKYSLADELVAEQAIAALEVNLHPIICIGESEAEREKGKEKDVVATSLKLLPVESDITISYEPVWAIGTGKTPLPEEIQDMMSFIRESLPADNRENTRILYGGSMNGINCDAILDLPDVDGGLIGGASLDPVIFSEIVEATER